MSGRGSRPYPEKKKHHTKPRPDVVAPLTDTERHDRMRIAFGLALGQLAEAERLAAWGGAPHSCVHAAYYAMHHCAAASLLASGGVGPRRNSPASHAHVLEHFARLVEGENEGLVRAAASFARAHLDRMTADYGAAGGDASSDGRDTTAEARRMIDCRARWELAPPWGAEP